MTVRKIGRYRSNAANQAPNVPTPRSTRTTGPMQQADATVAATTDATAVFIDSFRRAQ